MHLLRFLPGSLSGGCHRRRAELRIRNRNARGALFLEREASQQWRSLGAGNRRQPRRRCALPLRGKRMTLPLFFYYLFTAIAVASAFMVISSRNPVHAVLFLILTFDNGAGLFMLAGAEF